MDRNQGKVREFKKKGQSGNSERLSKLKSFPYFKFNLIISVSTEMPRGQGQVREAESQRKALKLRDIRFHSCRLNFLAFVCNGLHNSSK